MKKKLFPLVCSVFPFLELNDPAAPAPGPRYIDSVPLGLFDQLYRLGPDGLLTRLDTRTAAGRAAVIIEPGCSYTTAPSWRHAAQKFARLGVL